MYVCQKFEDKFQYAWRTIKQFWVENIFLFDSYSRPWPWIAAENISGTRFVLTVGIIALNDFTNTLEKHMASLQGTLTEVVVLTEL